jgi:STE24 endopeptidase
MPDRARRYHRLHLVIGIASFVIALAFLAITTALAVGPFRPPMPAGLGQLALAVAVEAAILGVALNVVRLPLTVIGGYVLPRRYGLLHQSLAAWLADRLKAAAIGGALGLLAIEILYLLIATTPWWWLVGAAVFFAGYALLAMVVPIWLLPLFYRLTPLADETLRARLVRLADRLGVPIVGVSVADQSRKSRTANAAVVGLGRTRRVVLFDTLLREFTPDEIEAVLAHELGHHVHGDVRRGLLFQGGLTVVTFWLADRLLHVGVAVLGLRNVADPAGLPWLLLVLTVLGALAVPIANAYSRWVERQADDFALRTTRDVPAFVGAMERLATLNLAERRPSRLEEWLLYSHPSIDRRIERARQAA